jgi:hypothetical protein
MATAIGVRSMISKHITNNNFPYMTAMLFDTVRTLPTPFSPKIFEFSHTLIPNFFGM